LGINAEIFHIQPKNRKMKKVLAIAFIAATLVACNNSSEKKEGTTDTTVKSDTMTPAPAMTDTTVHSDTGMNKMDTTHK
jgi:hypothetical protein